MIDYKFVINGEETKVTARPETLLSELMLRALQQSGNVGRPLHDFQPICNDVHLQPSYPMNDQIIENTGQPLEITEQSVIFLSLKFAMGS